MWGAFKCKCRIFFIQQCKWETFYGNFAEITD